MHVFVRASIEVLTKYHGKIFVTMTFEVQIKLYCSFFLSIDVFKYKPHSCNFRYCSYEHSLLPIFKVNRAVKRTSIMRALS